MFQFSLFHRNGFIFSDVNRINSKRQKKPKWFSHFWGVFGLLFLSISSHCFADPSSDMIADLPGQSASPSPKSQPEQTLDAFGATSSTTNQSIPSSKSVQSTGSWQPLPPVSVPKQGSPPVVGKSQPKNLAPKVENFNNMATPVILDEGSALVPATENSQLSAPSKSATSATSGEKTSSGGSQSQAVHSSFPPS